MWSIWLGPLLRLLRGQWTCYLSSIAPHLLAPYQDSISSTLKPQKSMMKMFSPSKITRLNISNILSICIIQMSQSASSYVNLMDFSPQEKPIPWRSSGSPQFSVVLTLTSSGLSVTALAETPQCRKVRPCCLGVFFFEKLGPPHLQREDLDDDVLYKIYM